MRSHELVDDYNISKATIRNWIKLKYIEKSEALSREKIEHILNSKIKNHRLSKKHSTDYSVPTDYVSSSATIKLARDIIELSQISGMSQIAFKKSFLTYFAIQNDIYTKDVQFEINKVYPLFLENFDYSIFNDIDFIYSTEDDLLGLIYMSMKTIGERTKQGIYYTPKLVIDDMLQSIDLRKYKTFLDPACGSGNFLVSIFKKLIKNNNSSKHVLSKIHGVEIDSESALLCKLNLMILSGIKDINQINIYNEDTLFYNTNMDFDLVIGNPPWGYKYNKDYLDKIQELFGKKLSKFDSFALMIHKGMKFLSENGELFYVLPKSILNVDKHKDIRNELLNKKIVAIKTNGRQFSEVYTDSIYLRVSNQEFAEETMVKYNNLEIPQSYFIKKGSNELLCYRNSIEKSIMEKLMNNSKIFYLEGKVEFALGIVTGDNKNKLFDKYSEGLLPILKGKDISKINYSLSKCKYTRYNRDSFQQIAPDRFYFADEKLLYKFIGNKLTFAYDNQQMLTLNSCNIIISKGEVDLKYIVGILNTRVLQLYYDIYFGAHKLLRRHIERFPILDLEEEKIGIINYVEGYLKNPNDNALQSINNIIYETLNLNKEEIEYLEGY